MEDGLINVVCLKWGNLYSHKYVNNLYYGVKRNSTIPFNFICLTDDKTGIIDEVTCQEIKDDGVPLQGWWNKMTLFNDENNFKDPCLYFDLDTLIVNNIDEILKLDTAFSIMDKGIFDDNPSERGVYASGVMSWQPAIMNELWNIFCQNLDKIKLFQGDQDFISRFVKSPLILQEQFPKRFVSYKWNCYDDGIPEGASVVNFHGTPKPHEAIEDTHFVHGKEYKPRNWVKKYWS